MEIKIIEKKQIWDDFFNQNGSPSFLQSWEWGEFQSKMSHGILRLGLYEKKELITVAQIIKIRARRGQFLFIPHGPIFSISNIKYQISKRKFLISQLLNYLISLAEKEDYSFIRIALILENTPENQKIFSDLGFRTAPIYMHAETVWVLPLTKTDSVNEIGDDELLSQMRKTTRYSIKKAIREGVIIEKRTDEKAVDDFYKIYRETAKRENFIPFSKDFIKCEFEAFHKTGNALFLFGKVKKQVTGVEVEGLPTARSRGVLFEASTDGRETETGPVAAALILFTKSTAFYHQGASIHTKIPVTYLLQWEAIKEAKRRGCQFYNFWGIYDEKTGRMPKSWQGLTLFKTGFGGQKIQYLPTQDYIISPKYFFTYIWEKILFWKREFNTA